MKLTSKAKARQLFGDAAARAIFSEAYYARRYPDVTAAGVDPLTHFMSVGWAETRFPCALFDTELYLERYPEVAQAGQNPLLHYAHAEPHEARQVSLLFDASWYLAKNPDVAEANVNPLAHYLSNGAGEGREANPLFDQTWYLHCNPHVPAAQALAHFAEYGAQDRSSPHPLFDSAFYLDRYPDVERANMNPLAHFLLRGHEEPRQPHLLFDVEWYLNEYPDVAQASVNPLLHYLWEGAKEGRNPNAEFDTAWYRAAHPEIGATNPLAHYVQHGRALGHATRPTAYKIDADIAVVPAAPIKSPERIAIEVHFDERYYLSQNPDLADVDDPLQHFLDTGWNEGRDPSPNFSVRQYLADYPDVDHAQVNPFVHYWTQGQIEGRVSAPSRPPASPERLIIEPHFDEIFYRARNHDLQNTPDVIEHFLEVGWKEKRDPSPEFSIEAYLATYPDVERAGINPFVHYLTQGLIEGRTTSPSRPAASPERALIKLHFDEAFYRARNPDLDEEIDLVGHFLDHGWREDRDPSPTFSIEHYLAAYPDIKKAGVNPLVHYLTQGRIEGRAAEPSRMLRHAPKTKPALGLATMVKNEADIIDAFMRHALALFDTIVVIDHGSTDGTREYLDEVAARYLNVTVFDLKVPSYIQALTMTFVARECPQLKNVDWLFLLDADEFLPFDTKERLLKALARHAHMPVISMPWRNAAPMSYWEGRVSLSPETAIVSLAQPSPYQKIAFQPNLLAGRRFWIDQGNHALRTRRDGDIVDAAPGAFEVMHLPVRSPAQLQLKLSQGARAYSRLGRARDPSQGAHWFKLSDALAGKALTPELLNGVVVRYGEDGLVAPLSTQDILDRGGVQRPLGAATMDLTIGAPQSKATAHLGATDDAHEAPAPVQLEFRGAEIHAASSPRPEFAALPNEFREAGADSTSDLRFLTDVVRPSYWDIAHLMPGSWVGHIPFMFCLAAMFQPRRFVELGSHYGSSFFAYCQAAKRAGFSTEAIAVDCWQGDEHAGYYDGSVFDQFKFVLRNYDDIGSYLRMYFNDAAKLFADGSIDLLHIDGLHTYEAVREDYETWLPKMSARGVILFHDNNVHERDFGVWRFWKELQRKHPTMEFRQSHGLGVAYVGARSGSVIERFIDIANSSDEASDFIQQHFEEMAQKSTELFNNRHAIRIHDAQSAAAAESGEELTRLRQELATLRRENSGFRSLIRAPTL